MREVKYKIALCHVDCISGVRIRITAAGVELDQFGLLFVFFFHAQMLIENPLENGRKSRSISVC